MEINQEKFIMMQIYVFIGDRGPGFVKLNDSVFDNFEMPAARRFMLILSMTLIVPFQYYWPTIIYNSYLN